MPHDDGVVRLGLPKTRPMAKDDDIDDVMELHHGQLRRMHHGGDVGVVHSNLFQAGLAPGSEKRKLNFITACYRSPKKDHFQNGMLSALPYLAQWVSKMLFAVVADALKKRTTFSPTWICRLSNTLSKPFLRKRWMTYYSIFLDTFVAGALLIACGYMDCSQTALAVFFLTAANFVSSGQVTGYFTSLVCIAPAYTGLVNAFARFSGQVASVTAPYIVGAITVEVGRHGNERRSRVSLDPFQGTAEEWKIVYYITAAALIVTGVHFMFYGSGKPLAPIRKTISSTVSVSAEVQSWAVMQDDAVATITVPDEKEDRPSNIDPSKLAGNWLSIPAVRKNSRN